MTVYATCNKTFDYSKEPTSRLNLLPAYSPLRKSSVQCPKNPKKLSGCSMQQTLKLPKEDALSSSYLLLTVLPLACHAPKSRNPYTKPATKFPRSNFVITVITNVRHSMWPTTSVQPIKICECVLLQIAEGRKGVEYPFALTPLR